MSRSRRFFEPADDRSNRGPSDEMLAVDAATELRSLTLLYERWADRLYRYFLLSTGDPAVAGRMLRDLITRLPEELQRFAGQDRSFAGWLFGRASEVFWREYSLPNRAYRRVSRYLPQRFGGSNQPDAAKSAREQSPMLAGFGEIAGALRAMTPDRREVLGIHFGAGLGTAPAAEALRLPASLMSSHVQWAMQDFSEHLGVSNNRRLTEELQDVISRQSLSSQERQRHFSLMHGVVLGEVEIQDDEVERAPIFEIAALVGVVLIGLLGIWVWGLVTEGDTREHEIASPAVEVVADDDPAPTPTAEPEPTEEAEAEAMTTDAEPRGTCLPADGQARFNQFINAYNTGDFEQVQGMIPGDDYENPLLTDADNDEPAHGPHFLHNEIESSDHEEILDFLEERYELGERWDVLDAYPAEHYRNWHGAAPLEMYQDWKREHPGFSMILVAGLDWSGAEDDQDIAIGRVVVDCDTGFIVSWDLQPSADGIDGSVSVSDFLEAMNPLESGEGREIQALVRAESRSDGGLLRSWRIVWSEAIVDNGLMAERIDVLTLDAVPLISYVNDGQRWSLDQRGWQMYGADGDPPLPDEITLITEWLPRFPELLQSFEIPADGLANDSYELTADVSEDRVGAPTHELTVGISAGSIRGFRVEESTPTDTRIRPEIRINSVERGDLLSPDRFEIDEEDAFPELDVHAPRYHIPDDDFSQLELLDVAVADDQESERYRISWNEVEFDLTVRPSRGGLDVESIPSSFDESWTMSSADYRWGTLVWAYRQFAGYPTEALWDDGRYRFELSVDRESIDPEHGWSLKELITLADVLSMDLAEEFDIESFSSGGGAGVGYARGTLGSTPLTGY
jgi:DNA-directed RNA polymerase specialized sigma24 family protein